MKFVRMDVDGPCSDITPNMQDMRSKFGYITLNKISTYPYLNIFHRDLASLKHEQEKRKAIASQQLINMV